MFKAIEISNDVYLKKTDLSYNKDIIEKMRNSDLIKEKDLHNGISSFSYTKQSFFSNKFDELNVKARGLFIYNEDSPHCGKVCARFHNKCFNVYVDEEWLDRDNQEREFSDCSLDSIINEVKYPLTAYRKENGFLGLITYNLNTDYLEFFTKSTNTGDYVGWFKDIFIKHLKPDYEPTTWDDFDNYICKTLAKGIQLKSFLKEKNITLAFEVIDVVNDPHIIKYEKSHIVLLDAYYNDFSDKKLSYKELVDIANVFGFEVKLKYRIITDSLALKQLISINESMHSIFHIEGFVIEDRTGFQFKYKTKYYRYWKRLRSIFERMKEHKSFLVPREYAIVTDFMSKLNLKEYNSIIDVRDVYNRDILQHQETHNE